MLTVDFLFDFASPNAYIAHKAIPAIAARTGATFNYIPCLLGGIFKATGNQAPMMTYMNVPAKIAYEEIDMKRYIHEYDLKAFTFNPNFPINTLHLMRGAIATQQQNQPAFFSYIDLMFSAMWETGKNLNDANVLTDVLNEAQYDTDKFLTNSQESTVKQTLINNTQMAVDKGAFGIPSFIFNDQLFFGKDRLNQLEAEINRQKS